MSTTSLSVVDFHSHHVPPQWPLTTLANFAPDQRARWERINKRLSDPSALLEGIDDGDISARVVNIPTALFSRPDDVVPGDTFRRVNDQIAELVSKQPNRLYGIASVDAFSGDDGAAELTRAVRQLRLRGVFLESEKNGRLLDAPEARPTLSAAAALGVPVFAHPVNPQPFTQQMSRFGHVGTLFARGTINAATLIALLEGRVFEELPELRVVVTNLAIGGVLLARSFANRNESEDGVDALLRRHVYIDTMGFDPSLIRAAADVLGVEHVLAGSDWPIVSDGPIRATLQHALTQAGFTADEQRLIAGSNTRKLLGV